MNVVEILGEPAWQVLPFGVALGASLYLGIVVICLAQLLLSDVSAPGDLGFIATGPVAVMAALLYVGTWVARRHRILEVIWEWGNVAVRVVAVGLLSVLVVGAASPGVQSVAFLVGGGLAAFVQLARVGWLTLVHHMNWMPAFRWLPGLSADVLTIGLLWVSLTQPVGAVGLSSLLILLFLAGAGRLPLRAVRFSSATVLGLVRWASGKSGWRSGERPPQWLRRTFAESAGYGPDTLRYTRAALARPDSPRAFWYGWLVMDGAGPALVFRTLNRLWEIPLAGARIESSARFPHLFELRLRDEDGRTVLLVPAGGPTPEEVGATFRPSVTRSGL